MDLVGEQMEYYRQRSGEYDQWWFRQGQYTLPPDAERRWFADVAEARGALDRFQPSGEVIEFACGTGLWTRQLIRHARRVTAVDSAAEMIALNRRHAASSTAVRYVQADIFAWTPPPASFDVAFFGYWLSHVPATHWTAFWTMVASALRPGGRVFLVDSYHPNPVHGETQQRVLNDGRQFSVVKRFWQPAELIAAACAVDWQLTVSVTSNEGILYASGTHSPNPT